MKHLISTLLGFTLLTSFAATFDVTEYGAKHDGTTDNTASLQKAIDACSAAGGGTVLVPGGGVYKTYTLNLKNNVELRIDRGATVKGGEDALKYPPFPPTGVWRSDRCPRWNHRAMFYTVGATNVAITGSGTIDGNAESFHERVNGRWRRISATNITGRCVFFVGCRDVRFDDILVYHPSGWSTWFLDCDRVQCRGVRIECHREFPNGDGLHFGGCRDVTVSDCLIDAQDDAIILRSHQEQMNAPKPCERVTVMNCVLRSNQSAIRIGWTGDAEVKNATFSNIICPYSRLGVQFFLPKLRNPRHNVDPVRGEGVPIPDFPLAPFAVDNLRFDNMQVDSYTSPFVIDIGASENVAYIRNITFSNCKFVSQQPPVFHCRPEDHVSDWRFSNVEFQVKKPRGSLPPATGLWFDNAKNITFNNVSWSYLPDEMPEWSVVLEQVAGTGAKKAPLVRIAGARQPVHVTTGADGAKRFVCESLTDGEKAWKIRVELVETTTPSGRSYTGSIVNDDPGIRVRNFCGPFFDRVRTNPQTAQLIVPDGLGRRIRKFPASDKGLKPVPPLSEDWNRVAWHATGDGRVVLAMGNYPGATGMTLPFFALDGEGQGVTAQIHDPIPAPKRMLLRYDPREERSDLGFDHGLFLDAGSSWMLPKTVFKTYAGDWHVAAKFYRSWYDTVHPVAVNRPKWTTSFSGWLLVIMRQQNEELIWPYTDIPKLCDVAEANGLTCIGLFGWTKGGHDHLYPDYDPDPKMGGVAALKAGIAEAHRRGISVYIYANGQLQQVGVTKFWDEYGKYNALTHEDGSLVLQHYHKYSTTPKYDFALGCLWSKPWYERMKSLAFQAESFGADGILYDQLGIFAPFVCWGKGHGHPSPGYAYATERPDFIRNIRQAIQAKNPNFAILTEGLHDSILDSISVFHGCENGTFANQALARAKSASVEIYPEFWRYTFPELITSTRTPSPMETREMINYTAVYGMRHDIELRYAPDRRWALEGKVPTKADYATINSPADYVTLQKTDPKAIAAYQKAVNLLQRKYAKYLLTGRFVDEEGVPAHDESLLAKRFVAADGTSAILAWNTGDKPMTLAWSASSAAEPGKARADMKSPLAANSLRLFISEK